MSFWNNIKKPFVALAPMADVTDVAFREMFSKYGKPDIFWTEFVSSDGLVHKDASEKLLLDLKFEEGQRPIIAQLFTSNAENMFLSVDMCNKLGFDGVDINMGCPDKNIEKQGCGANMINNKEKAKEIIDSAKKVKGIPISVKTRLGYNSIDLNWIEFLLKQNISALTVHLRTRKEMSSVNAHWEAIPSIIKLRDKIAPKTLIIGNGDIRTTEEALEYIDKYGCDGVMLGRGIFGNPWVFNKDIKKEDLSIEIRLKALIEHTKLFNKYFNSVKSFNIMKKHYKSYIGVFPGAKELRLKLMDAKNYNEVTKIIKRYLDKV